jgi:hypothetical protein
MSTHRTVTASMATMLIKMCSPQINTTIVSLFRNKNKIDFMTEKSKTNNRGIQFWITLALTT